MKLPLASVLLGVSICQAFAASPVAAGCIVIANRTGQELRFTLTPAQGKPRDHTVVARDLVAVASDGTAVLTFAGKAKHHEYQLPTNTAYYFADFPEGLDLKALAFTSPETTAAEKAPPNRAADKETATLRVKILVDDAEPTVQAVWEKRLRRRVAEASDFLERYCRVQVAVVGVGTWSSEDQTSLPELLADFRRKVEPPPGGVALGFTSRHVETEGARRLGGIRTPLQGHILCREWAPRSEPERLEVLLHELGHYLGAAHSPEQDSVMRPILGDGQALRRSFRVGFDPLNLLAMNLVADEWRTRGIRDLGAVSPATRACLLRIYAEIARALPKDPVAALYLRVLGKPGGAVGSPGR